ILVAFDRQARLTDFDRAYIEDTQTVFAGTAQRRRNPDYTAPELRDVTDYDFNACADMYSLGVLLFELLTERVPERDERSSRAVRTGGAERLGDLTGPRLEPKDWAAGPAAEEALAVLRAVLGSTEERRKPVSEPRAAPRENLERGDVIDGQYRVDDILGSGF